MYFPYFRGRQYELLALKELATKKLISSAIVPIIEPVKIIPALNNCVKQPLIDQHGFELPVRHSYSLKHSKFTAAGKNTGHHGVEEI